MRYAITLLLALCVAIALPASASATKLRYIDIFEDFSDNAVDDTSVRMCWSGDHTSEAESWTIRESVGSTTPPPEDSISLVTLTGGRSTVCYTAVGLVPDWTYTFRITGNNGGDESEPGIFTVAPRTPGDFVLSGDSSEILPGSSEHGTARVAVTPRDRRWHALYERSVKGVGRGLYYSTRTRDGWTKPKLTAGAGTVDGFWLLANRGTLTAAWRSYAYRPRYRTKLSGAGFFGASHPVPTRDDVADTAIDRRGRLHMLVERFPGDVKNQRLLYTTNSSGRFRTQQLPSKPCPNVVSPPGCVPGPLLATDPVTDRIVALTQFGDVKIATKRASAKSFGAFHTVTAANKDHLVATGLTSRGGRITIGLQSSSGRVPSEGAGPLYVLTDGQLVQVPGTTADDWNMRVAASSRDRVQLAWERRSASWDRNQQGIWTAESVRDKTTGQWSIRAIRHRTVSHYDHLTSLTVDARGRALAAYVR